MTRGSTKLQTLQRYRELHSRCNSCNPFNFVTSLVGPARARNTRPRRSDTGETSRRVSSALSAWEVSVCEKFWRSPSALHNRRLAKHPAGQGQTAEASPQSTDLSRGAAEGE